MNTLLFLIGGYFFTEGTINVCFFKHFKAKFPRGTSKLFQLGRLFRALLGFALIMMSVV